jgi:HAD superfamily hydrolase (TIGR01509 family)
MKIDGAIFDVDGTLLDSMAIWEHLGNDYLLSRGIKPRENLADTFRAMSLPQAAEYYRTHYGIPDPIQKIVEDINQLVRLQYLNTVPLKPGVSDFLSFLYGKGIPMCIATATDRYLIHAALTRCGVLGFFTHIFTCQDIGSGKDHPDIYLKALDYLQTTPEHTAIFEDAYHAIQTAAGTGCQVIGVYDPYEPTPAIDIQKWTTYYIHSFDEMRDFID